MKKNKVIVSITLIIILAYGCNNRIKYESDILLKVKDINFKRPDGSRDFHHIQYVEEDTCNLLVTSDSPYGSSRNFLNLYDINKENLVKSIKIPDNIKLKLFYYKNIDSIFIAPGLSSSIYMMNEMAVTDTLFYIHNIDQLIKILNTYDLASGMEFAQSNIAPLIIEDSVILVYNLTDILIEPENLRPLLMIYPNKDSVVINTIAGRFPSKLIKDEETLFPFTSLIISYTRNNKNQTIISFEPDHNLYIYSDTVLIKEIECKSIYIKKLPEFISKKLINNQSFNDIMDERHDKESFYYGIYYDKYRDCYIRTAKISNLIKSKNGLNDAQNYKFSIMILNNNFEIISEQVFNNKEYDVLSLVVTKDGIMLKKHDDLSGITRYTLFGFNPEILIN